MADDDRPFVIAVRRPWTLWILPVIAALYFLAVILLNVLNYTIEGVTMDMLVLAGLGIFILIIVIELPFFLRRRSHRQPPPVAARAAAPSGASLNGWDDELTTTSEKQQGLQIVEYSAPAKSRNSNSVYTKTYVPVTGAHVLRIETLVADPTDI